MEKEITCPKCGIELPEINFKVMIMLNDDYDYWCPECGHEWAMFDSDECVGFGRTGTHKCCDRAGEYNGFASGPLLFECPENCPCHD